MAEEFKPDRERTGEGVMQEVERKQKIQAEGINSVQSKKSDNTFGKL